MARTSSVSAQLSSARSVRRTPEAPGQLGYHLAGGVSESGSCASSVVGIGPGVRDQSLMGDNMSTYLKYIALPEVRVYSGRDRDYTWENFIEAFPLKYPTHSWSGAELKALLKSKLSDKAKAQFDALPTAVKHGSFEGVVAALANSNKVEARTNRIIALGKLRQLRKTDAQSVAEYCVELERWSSRAYPELDEKALATARAQQLYEQLVGWPESYHLLKAMERDGPNTYENLKEAAMRVERRRLTLETVREPRFRGDNGEHIQAWPQRRQEADQEDRRRTMREWELQKEGPSTGAGEDAYQEHSIKDLQGRCFRCKGKGHRAKECKYTNRDELGSRAMVVEDQPRRPMKRDCQVKSSEDESTGVGLSPYGNRCTTRVEISGRVWTAVLDTGSEISILPIGIFHQIEKDGGTWREAPLDQSKRILDASGRLMRFSSIVEVPLKECGKGEVNIRMHVCRRKGNTLVLGTNALSALNYKLVCQSKPAEREVVKVPKETRHRVWLATVEGQQPNAREKVPALENKTAVVQNERKRARRKRMSVLHSRTITLDSVASSRVEDDCEVNSWDKLNEKARQHLHTYLDTHLDLLPQLRDLVQAEPGVLKAVMACLVVGVVEDPRRWWSWAQATEFYRYLRNQLQDMVTLEEVRMSKSAMKTGKPSGPESLGKPALRDGRVLKRHLKRVEKRKERSLRRATEQALNSLDLGS